MNIPFELFLSQLGEKQIYFFKDTATIGIKKHFHIIMKNAEGNTLYFVCCSSKFESTLRFITKVGESDKTLVEIKKNNKNSFTKDTYINCNNVRQCDIKDFYNHYIERKVERCADLDHADYVNIIRGILVSRQVPLEIKEIFQEIDNIT